MSFRVKDQLRRHRADYVQCGLFKAIAVRDGRPQHARRHYDCVAVPGSPYNHAILSTPTLPGYWPLAETRGTVAYDVFGANHGSYIGHPGLGVPGAKPTATAVGLNGLDQYVLLPR